MQSSVSSIDNRLSACIAALNLHSTSNEISTRMRYSVDALQFCAFLFRNGYISSYHLENVSTYSRAIRVFYKMHKNRKAFTGIRQISRPGRRIFVKDVPTFLRHHKTYIDAVISTSEGYMTIEQALKRRLGGELVARVLV